MRRTASLIALTVVAASVVVTGCARGGSKGTIPPPGANGEVDASAAPDFLAVAGNGPGIAGYARQEDMLDPGDGPFPVFADDLRTVVGQMIPGRGFVPAGVDPESVPTFAVEVGPSGNSNAGASGNVVLYVRNDSAAQAWVVVQIGGQPWDSGGYWGGNLGVGCYSMPQGSRLVLLDRSPQEEGSTVVRPIYVRGDEAAPPSLWISIAADGAVQQGTGVPGWWGDPQSC
jgi:hypothetical protein